MKAHAGGFMFASSFIINERGNVLKKVPKMRELFAHIRQLMLGEKSLRGNLGIPAIDGLIDQQSYSVIEIDNLLDVVDHTQTLVGKETVHKAFSQQCLSPEEIDSRQQALREIADDKALRDSLQGLLQKAAKYENSFYRLLFVRFIGFIFSPEEDRLEEAGYGYQLYAKAVKFLPSVVAEAKQLKAIKSPYLKGLIDEIVLFGNSRECHLMQGPVYMWLGKMYLRQEKTWYMLAVKLRLSLFKPMLLPLVFIVTVASPYILNISIAQFTVFALLPFLLLVFYVPIVGGFDKDAFIIPLRRLFVRSAKVERAVKVIGLLDELMSYHQYAVKSVHKTILPTMQLAANQFIHVTGAVNPVLAFNDPNYIANDFDTSRHNLAFFTGPNSGGKTAFCKTLAQIQLLSQVGCYVPAESATLTIADRVYYQTPEVNSLDHDVGRFGTELKRTRDIFKLATPNSLVILDELAEGTTHKEKLETSLMILEAFKQLGSLTILVTHNHELAEHYQDAGLAIFRQVEFANNQPTHRFIDGVSIISHADLVAHQVGFSKDDINRILQEKTGTTTMHNDTE